jgi:hypothetical protein
MKKVRKIQHIKQKKFYIKSIFFYLLNHVDIIRTRIFK